MSSNKDTDKQIDIQILDGNAKMTIAYTHAKPHLKNIAEKLIAESDDSLDIEIICRQAFQLGWEEGVKYGSVKGGAF